MPRKFSVRLKRWLSGLILLLLAGLAVFAWAERKRLLVWYSVRRLTSAGETERNRWKERVARFDEVAVPPLLNCLRREDERSCTNACETLSLLVERWGLDDARSAALADHLADAFAGLSVAGQAASLDMAAAWVQIGGRQLSAELLRSSVRLLNSAAQRLPKEANGRWLVHGARPAERSPAKPALALATALLRISTKGDVLAVCRELALACLRDGDSNIRLQASCLACQPAVRLLAQVVPLLDDPDPQVRRAALLAVGRIPEAIHTDTLLRWLHDPDTEVRDLCVKALRSRGLRDEHLKLGRLKTDNNPKVRLEVLQHLPRAADLDPGVWLRSLTHDPAPAVRAAAIRAAAEQTLVDLTDRMQQMAQNDPSPTVRQLARYYLVCKSAEHFRSVPAKRTSDQISAPQKPEGQRSLKVD